MAKETFGEYIKRERQLRQITLEEVADGTKIAIHMLRAIEADKWEDLPAEVFTRGFVKSYAEYIGLVPEDVLLRYEEERAKERDHDQPEEPDLVKDLPRATPPKAPHSLLPWVVGVAIVLLAGAAIWFFSQP